jgi:hypothetical protein
MIACELKPGEKIPLNASKIGIFKSGDPIYSCCDSRKDDCEYFVEYKNIRGVLMICGFITDCKNNPPE